MQFQTTDRMPLLDRKGRLTQPSWATEDAFYYNKQEHEIQTCFNALYGTMMLRLQKKPVTPETEHAIREITTLIGMLSDYYKADKAGELALMDNE